MQQLKGIHWKKGYFKDDPTWKENLRLYLQNTTCSFSAQVTSPHCKNNIVKRSMFTKYS